ncbi:MAG: hypothetical protein JW786_11770 [Desulfobacterales bacterium]|nr:hypothetical protein [Desulfobacterales bacterium]
MFYFSAGERLFDGSSLIVVLAVIRFPELGEEEDNHVREFDRKFGIFGLIRNDFYRRFDFFTLRSSGKREKNTVYVGVVLFEVMVERREIESNLRDNSISSGSK